MRVNFIPNKVENMLIKSYYNIFKMRVNFTPNKMGSFALKTSRPMIFFHFYINKCDRHNEYNK